MYRKIMVPIDVAHPEKGKPAIDIAKRLVDKNGEIILFGVIEDVPTFISAQLPRGIIEEKRDDAANALQAMANAALVKARIEARSGNPRVAILAAAAQYNVDLIIIGSHKPGMQDYLIGSTAARVVRHATCSVFVVR